jgi:hypothetical protein
LEEAVCGVPTLRQEDQDCAGRQLLLAPCTDCGAE